MKKLCLAALAAATLIGCSDNKEEESAAAESVRKAQRLIDEQGERLFDRAR